MRPDFLPEKPDAETCGYMDRQAPTPAVLIVLLMLRRV